MSPQFWRDCHLTLRSKVSRIKTNHQVKHYLSLTMARNCTIVVSPDVCFKWSRGPRRNHLTSKALGHHFPSTPSTNNWKSYLYNSPVTKALSKKVRARVQTHSPRRLFCLPGWWSILSGVIPPPESVVVCSQTHSRWQENKASEQNEIIGCVGQRG